MTYRQRTILAGAMIVIFLALGMAFLGVRSPISAESSSTNSSSKVKDKILEGKNILFVIAPENFRDEELFDTRKYLTNWGAKTKVVSTVVEPVRGMLGATVKPDGLIADEKAENYDCIVFVGGSGATVLWDNLDVRKLVQNAYGLKKVIAAICLAPVILARAKILGDCQATVFHSAKKEIIKSGAKYVDTPVVRCGNIITANGPSAIPQFAQKIKDALLEENLDKSRPKNEK